MALWDLQRCNLAVKAGAEDCRHMVVKETRFTFMNGSKENFGRTIERKYTVKPHGIVVMEVEVRKHKDRLCGKCTGERVGPSAWSDQL